MVWRKRTEGLFIMEGRKEWLFWNQHLHFRFNEICAALIYYVIRLWTHFPKEKIYVCVSVNNPCSSLLGVFLVSECFCVRPRGERGWRDVQGAAPPESSRFSPQHLYQTAVTTAVASGDPIPLVLTGTCTHVTYPPPHTHTIKNNFRKSF